MTTHFSLSTCYSCQPTPHATFAAWWSRTTRLPFNLTTRDKFCTNSIRLVLPSSHSHELGAEDTLPLTAFYADYSNWLRSGDSCELAPISAQISIIFIVPEFQCTSRCSRIRDPGFDNAVALRQQYLRPIAGSTVFLASADVASFLHDGCKH